LRKGLTAIVEDIVQVHTVIEKLKADIFDLVCAQDKEYLRQRVAQLEAISQHQRRTGKWLPRISQNV